ncbi:MAG: 50S ribosomal protein L9, partial [Gammaproteobacteria bacterium]
LFGSVGVAEIAAALTAAGVDIAKREVSLPEGPIRMVGEYEIDIHLHSDVTQTVKVNVIAE